MSDFKGTPGPWTAEGFEQIVGNGEFHGGLIMGADGETVVAQCVMPQNMPIVRSAPELLDALTKVSDAAHEALFFMKDAMRDDPRFEPIIELLDKATDEGYAAISKATGAA
jgi:dihydrodipicolinate synthase/N-acetylneuraminate lyase